MTKAPTILVLNAGSSSIKFQLFAIEDGAPQRQYRGQVEGIGAQPRLIVADAERAPVFERSFEPSEVADAEEPESFSAIMSDGLFVGNTDDQTLLALERSRFWIEHFPLSQLQR